MRGQRAAVALRGFAARRGVWLAAAQSRQHGFEAGLLFRQRLFQIVEALLDLLVAELLGSAAETIALQARDQQTQPFDLRRRGTQDQLQRGWIIGQGRRDGEHARAMNRRRESSPMNNT